MPYRIVWLTSGVSREILDWLELSTILALEFLDIAGRATDASRKGRGFATSYIEEFSTILIKLFVREPGREGVDSTITAFDPGSQSE